MAKKLVVEIVGDSKSLDRAFAKSSKSAESLGSSFAKLGKIAVVAGAAIGVAAAVGMKKAVDAASNLTEQINKTNVVFKGSEKQVQDWSKGLASSFGLSQRAALEAAGTYGNMLVPMGFARKEAALMSEKMVELAGDMASFNNASPAETLDALRAGLAGETEPLRRFGVFLNDARLKQQALSMGLYSGKGALDAQAKAAATYAIILKDTADTQGDFARSAGTSVANQLRIAKAQFEDLAASIGSVLLPVVLKLLGILNKQIIPAFSAAGEAVKDFWSGLQKQLAKAPDFKTKLRITLTGVQELAGKFVNALVDQIAGLLPQKEIPLTFKVGAKGGAGAGAAASISEGVDWDAVASAMIIALSVALQASGELAKALADTIRNSVDQIPWEDVGRKMGPGLVTMLLAAFQAIMDPGFWIRNWDLALAVALAFFKVKIPGFAANAARAASASLIKLGEDMVGSILTAINRALPRLGPLMIVLIGRAIGAVVGALDNLWLKFRIKLLDLAEKIGPGLSRILRVGFIYAGINAIQALVETLAREWMRVVAWIQGLRPKVIGAFGDAATWLYNAGVQIIQGLWDGLKSKWDAVTGWLSGLGGKIASLKGPPAKDAVLLVENGKLIMAGLQRGMESGWMRSEAWLSGLGGKMSDKLSAAIDTAAAAISAKGGVLTSAFDGLVNAALAAFDKLQGDILTKSEKKLAAMEAARSAKERAAAVSDARAALTAASALTPTEGEDPVEFANRQREAMMAAQKSLDDALYAQQVAALEKKAENERKKQDETTALNRRHLEERLTAANNAYNRGAISLQTYHDRVLGIMKAYNIPFKKGAAKLGAALAEGLTEAFGGVQAAAKALAQEILDQFSKIKIVLNVDLSVKGGDKPKGKAIGGPVRAGQPYIVGEAGPELFIPRNSGRIAANDSAAMSGGGLNVTVNVGGSVVSERELTEAVYQSLLVRQRRIGALGFN